MVSQEFILKANDNKTIIVHLWLPDNIDKISGIMQIAHGMAEHAGRYNEFARFLTDNGFVVYANDHRGHGKTADSKDDLGFISVTNSWRAIIMDLWLVNNYIRDKFPNNKITLLGQSMGSFFARAYMEEYQESINGIILSGTSWIAIPLINFGLNVAKIQCAIKGERNRSKLLDKLSFGRYNKHFKPVKTPFDWLSRDQFTCKKYTNDEYCGFVCTSSFFRELFRLLKYIHSKKLYQTTNKKLPILLLSGAMDPVGNFSKGPKRVYAFLRDKGFSDISMNIYEGGRHEMLNEINKKEVYKDILNWLNNI